MNVMDDRSALLSPNLIDMVWRTSSVSSMCSDIEPCYTKLNPRKIIKSDGHAALPDIARTLPGMEAVVSRATADSDSLVVVDIPSGIYIYMNNRKEINNEIMTNGVGH
uniref:Uncharacterized protein n=1 Tax=Glossina palpalis gambiensis TaxID=67801 RepID=A0A1B0BZS5_9MUSC